MNESAYVLQVSSEHALTPFKTILFTTPTINVSFTTV